MSGQASHGWASEAERLRATAARILRGQDFTTAADRRFARECERRADELERAAAAAGGRAA